MGPYDPSDIPGPPGKASGLLPKPYGLCRELQPEAYGAIRSVRIRCLLYKISLFNGLSNAFKGLVKAFKGPYKGLLKASERSLKGLVRRNLIRTDRKLICMETMFHEKHTFTENKVF